MPTCILPKIKKVRTGEVRASRVGRTEIIHIFSSERKEELMGVQYSITEQACKKVPPDE